MADIVVGRCNPLGVVGVEQRGRRFAGEHEVELPGDILGIFETGIRAARTERRDLMRGIAGKNHPAMGEALHAPALEFVERDPLEFEIAMADHPLDARPHALRLLLQFRIGIGPELQIDAPDVVGLFVQQRGLPGMEGRIEPEPTFGRESPRSCARPQSGTDLRTPHR